MTPYRSRPARPWWQKTTGMMASIGIHLALAWFIVHNRDARTETVEQWVEMTIIENTPPEAPPPPEPEPEPEKPKPPPAPVKFEDTVKTPPPEAAPPPRKVRRVTGLSANSFAKGSGTGVSVRAGTTLSQKAGKETMGLDEAKGPISYTATTTRPKCRKPPLNEITVPPEIREQGIEGTVHVQLDISATGKVEAVRVTRPIHPVADRACASMWRRARCKPGKQGDTPVPVLQIPHRCTYKALP